MKPATQLWLEKAEADYLGALDLRRARRSSNRELVCYHCQQAVEKYLKTRLIDAGIAFPKTHDLRLLLKLVEPVEPLWLSLADPLAVLSAYAVELRYPGRVSSVVEVRDAVRTTERMRRMVLERLSGDLPSSHPRPRKPRKH